MNFQDADKFIHLFWSLPAILVLIYLASARRSKILNRLLGEKMGKKMTFSLNSSARTRKTIYFFIAWVLLLTALARPWWGEKLSEEKVSSRDILVCLDTSKSMLAKDISPTRLDHAKWWLKDLVKKCPGDRFGLINFAGTAIIECPLTSSSASFLDYLDGTDTDNIPTGGTNIGAALDTALNAFKGAEGAHHAVILVSDGDELEGDSSERLEDFKEKGIPVIAVGLGDPNQPGVIELPDGKILKDKEGNPVISKLNEQGLIRIATKTDGLYVRTTVAKPMTNAVYDRIMQLTPETKEGTKKNRRIERYQIPLLLALLFIMARLFAGERHKNRALTLLISLTLTNSTFAESDIPPQLIPVEEAPAVQQPIQLQPQIGQQPSAQGQQAAPKQPSPQELRKMQAIKERKQEIQELDQLLEKLEKAETPDQQEIDKTNFNIGVLYQKNENYEKATEYYEKLSTNPHKDLLKATMNNLSAIELEKAIKLLASDPTKALETLEQAQYYMRRALSAADGDKELIEKTRNNLQALFKCKHTARQMKKMQEKVEELFKNIAEKSQEAMKQQQQASKGKTLTEKTKPIEDIQKNLSSAQKSLDQLLKLMEMGKLPEEQLKQFKSAGDDLKRAEENAQKQLMPLSDPKREEMSNAVKQDIITALKKLGMNMDQQQQQQNQDQKDQQNKDQQQQQDQKDQKNQQKGDEQQPGDKQDDKNFDQLEKDLQKSSDEKDQKDAQKGKVMKEQKIDKKQAEAILKTMKEKEANLKDQLKKMQIEQQRRRGQIDKNW